MSNGAMSKRKIPGMRPVYPTPAALITSVDDAGKPNIITLGEVFNVSLRRPPIVGLAIRKATYSHGLISAHREFTVNMPTTDLLWATDYCGSTSGRNIDKFAASGLTPIPAETVAPPLIGECPVNMECRVISIQEVGDHDLFLGEVLATHVDESILDENGHPDPAKLDTFAFMFNHGHEGEYWDMGTKIGDHGLGRTTRSE